MGGKKQKITLGIALAIAILAAVVAVWIAVPLLLIAVLLFFWVWNLSARRHLSGVCRTSAITSSRHWLN